MRDVRFPLLSLSPRLRALLRRPSPQPLSGVGQSPRLTTVTAGRGGLALSRALGDLFYEEVVPTNADIYEHTVGAEDDFIVIGSDGLWDVMSSQNACTFVTQYFNRYPDKSAEEGATAMVARALRLRSMDNVAAVVVRLSPPEEATEANAQACETPRARL
mmetsp:Transcript_22029/g.61947  ORF Transcript_22029/g.61947 Transcript_22029/m.61947 type:complete len:160 (-) Transcript_22029:67-546(-)